MADVLKDTDHMEVEKNSTTVCVAMSGMSLKVATFAHFKQKRFCSGFLFFLWRAPASFFSSTCFSVARHVVTLSTAVQAFKIAP